MRHGNREEAAGHFNKVFKSVVEESTSWMAIVVSFEPNGEVKVNRTTWKFSGNQFLDAIAVIARNLSDEASVAAVPPPFSPLPFRVLSSNIRGETEIGPDKGDGKDIEVDEQSEERPL